MTPSMADTDLLLIRPVTVTLHVYQSDGVYEAQEVPRCQVDSEDAQVDSSGNVVIPTEKVVIHLWARNLTAGTVPKRPDVIEVPASEGARAGRYTVQAVMVLAHSCRYKCWCILEA